MKLYLNQGKLKFDQGRTLTAAGQPIVAGDGGPNLVDWNGDGILDLVLGDDTGNVQFFEGTARGATNFKAPVYLIPQVKQSEGWTPIKRDPKSPIGFSAKRPGVRVKPYVADWNGDGKLDLLVGDFIQIAGIEPKLTHAQVKQRDQYRKQLAELQNGLMARYEAAMQHAEKTTGLKNDGKLTKEQQDRWFAAYAEFLDKDPKFEEGSKKTQELMTKLRPLEKDDDATGFVWVYLRK